MKSRVVFLTLLAFFAFDLLTGTDAALPKWGSFIAGPPPPAPLLPPFPPLPSTEISPAFLGMEVTEAPGVSAAVSATLFAVELTESPAPVSAAQLFESPQISAAPAPSVSVPSDPDSAELVPLPSPSAPVKLSPKTSATPVSVLDLLDLIANLHGEDEQQPAETELPLVTPAASTEPLPLPLTPPESTTQPRDATEKRACFPSHARVTLRDGSDIPIARLRVGDLVESEPGHFSPVLLHTHADTHANTTFVVLRTRRGSQIAASPGHYLLTSAGLLRVARDFRVHDELRTASGLDRVASVRRSTYRGLHNPHTASGKLMVRLGAGGTAAVQASAYTTAVSPGAAHAALSPLRALHSTLGITVPALSALVRTVAAAVPLSDAVLQEDDHNRIGGALPRCTALLIYVRLLLCVCSIAASVDCAASAVLERTRPRMCLPVLCIFIFLPIRCLLTDSSIFKN